METLRPDSAAAALLASGLTTERFTLLDIGCSGGIHPAWRIFGDRLTAYAFDPSLHAIGSLKASESNPAVQYVAGFVGLPDGHPAKDADPDFWRVDPWGRLAASQTQLRQQAKAAVPQPEAAGAQQDLMDRNLWQEANLVQDDKVIVLPDFLDAAGCADIDVIKIDVDGRDFEILQSLRPVLAEKQVLGAVLEVNFHGSASPSANSFHNIDRFMRAQGFDLLDLSVRRYALDALPFPFLYPWPMAAQTTGGRPYQGDALYLRDFGYPHGGPDAAAWSDEKLLKLAALHSLFGLYDHAAETLTLFRDRLSRLVDVDKALDLLAAEIQAADADLQGGEPPASFSDYVADYQAETPRFYAAANRRHAAKLQDDGLANRLATVEAARLTAEAERDTARAALSAVTASTMWRLTGPLRALLTVLRRRRP